MGRIQPGLILGLHDGQPVFSSASYSPIPTPWWGRQAAAAMTRSKTRQPCLSSSLRAPGSVNSPTGPWVWVDEKHGLHASPVGLCPMPCAGWAVLDGNDPYKRCAGRVSLGLPNKGVEASRIALPYGHASIDSRLFLPCMATRRRGRAGAGAGEAWMERVRTPFGRERWLPPGEDGRDEPQSRLGKRRICGASWPGTPA